MITAVALILAVQTGFVSFVGVMAIGGLWIAKARR